MTDPGERYVDRAGLRVGRELAEFVTAEALPGTAIGEDDFWDAVARIIDRLTPRNRELLETRASLQAAIDRWHRDHPARDPAAYRTFLEDIGYLVPDGEPFTITTSGVHHEIAGVAGPQLVVPVTNARYAINAVNARWGSLYDALYGTDALGDTPPPGPYDPARGARVIAEARRILDDCMPLTGGSHTDSVAYRLDGDRLVVELADGTTVTTEPSVTLIGHTGERAAPSSIVTRHHDLHTRLLIDPAHPVGATDPAGLADVMLEAAVTVIMDCEDSVACVDSADKTLAYRNWLGLCRGTLTEEVTKDGRTFVRTMADDIDLTAPDGDPATLPGRSVMLVRNVGHLMTTPAVLDTHGDPVPEGILDAIMTVLGALPAESVYVVKPKMHGPDEVAFAVEVFAAVEAALGLPADTVKIGIMDEERRTTLNLAECIRAASNRVAFINTGFLDRTGDEIHTSMHAGPMVRKADMRAERWIAAYEDHNVDTGLACGLVGRAQIGKGMWAAPDLMADMLATKVGHPAAGASCAWVPSPTAATLHAVHYHRVDVRARQRELAERLAADGPRATLDDLMHIPVADSPTWSDEDIQAELDNNAQGILGYVVRWVDQGVGCSKVPDIHDVGLMEDRATCRISSQHMANWLLHGVVDADRVTATMRRMAAVVDRQNADDPTYTPMGPAFDGPAFRAACDLVLSGVEQPSGYTEPILHARRLDAKGRHA
ncbi:MAG: malate synthase G [Ilumatobacteraceae bacterium]